MQIIDKLLKLNFVQGREGYKPKAIVLHITEGSSASAWSWFNQLQSQASSHYLVCENGEVWRLVKEEDTAWHCGRVVNPTWKGLIPNVNPNKYTIGVEVALLTGSQMPAWKQWTATAKLVKDICQRWNIPQNELGIVNHREIRADKTCPGTWISRFYILILMKFV